MDSVIEQILSLPAGEAHFIYVGGYPLDTLFDHPKCVECTPGDLLMVDLLAKIPPDAETIIMSDTKRPYRMRINANALSRLGYRVVVLVSVRSPVNWTLRGDTLVRLSFTVGAPTADSIQCWIEAARNKRDKLTSQLETLEELRMHYVPQPAAKAPTRVIE